MRLSSSSSSSRFLPSVLTLTLIVAPVAWATLDFKRVHFVDRGPTNFLFRGNMPTNASGDFAYTELLSFLRNRSATEGNASGAPLPSTARLEIFSLNNDFDGHDFLVEREFWRDPAHAALGNLTQWPIGVAGVLPPSAFDPAKRAWMANESNPESVWAVDQVPARVRKIHELLMTPSDPPIAIYVHCTAGCDRTGEMIGAYIIEHLVPNVTIMYDQDTKECGRSPNYFSTSALEWYCYYYSGRTGSDIGDCLGFATCEPLKHGSPCTPTHNITQHLAL